MKSEQNLSLDPTAVAEAADRLQGIVNRTPIMTSRTLNEKTGCRVFLKCENFQRVGAFKFRGAYNALSQLSEAEKAAGVITHSSGNHAQGLALAAKLLGIRAVIVMPKDAPAAKRAATAGYGAEIVPCAAVHREKVTADLIEQYGYTLIHPYDNRQIIAGQGTAAWELFDEVGELDLLFVPVGGGGLISGSALAAAAKSPHCRVIGVEPAAGADANQSWRENRIVTLPEVPDTIADGLRTRFIGERNLAVMRRHVAGMTAVSETDILATLEFIWSRLKIVVEPSAAVALTPLFSGAYEAEGLRVGVIFSGGNVNVSACGFFHREADAVDGSGETAVSPADEPADEPIPSETRPRILITDPIDQAGLNILKSVAEIDRRHDLTPEGLLGVIGDYQGLIVGENRRVTGQMVEYGFNLRAIGSLSDHLDNVDVSAARAMGIEVFNAPASSAVIIAEHTMARLLALSNRFSDGRLAGKTLGLIGFGSVAQQVARRAQAFDINIVTNQPRLTPELAMSVNVQVVDLPDLLAQADFVSLHVPFKRETDAIIGREELVQMKPSACLINTGHTDLVDDAVLLQALQDGLLAGAVVASLPEEASIEEAPAAAKALRRDERVLVADHVTTILGDQQRETAVVVAQQIAGLLRTQQTSESLSLELVPAELVTPHEQIDDKRVARLMSRLEVDGYLVNPPLTTLWHGRYIILDGATRYTSLKRLGYPYVIVQVVQPDQKGFQLHTWYHAISSDREFGELIAHLEMLPEYRLTPLAPEEIPDAFEQDRALCYLLARDGSAMLAQAVEGVDELTAMNALVAAYTEWGEVERTLLTDLSRLRAQFPRMTAVAIFPQFTPEAVFDTAGSGDLLPAGLTRFVIPGRILRLNADLARLKREEPLAQKRAWFNHFLEEKLARSRLRYYQEPVILLDE